MTALWAALVLALITTAMLRSTRDDARISHTTFELAQLDAAADGAIELIKLRLLGSPGAAALPLDGTQITVLSGKYSVQTTVQDQAGLIDLNFASPDLLTHLLKVVGGLELPTAQALTDKILDWREPGVGKRLNGAKADDYSAAGYDYAPRNAPFESVAELKLVIDMTPALFKRLAPALTVYSQKPLVDPAVAPRPVLLLLPDQDANSVAAIIAKRNLASAQHQSVTNVAQWYSGRSISITAAVSNSTRATTTRSMVLRVIGSAQTPFWVYRTD